MIKALLVYLRKSIFLPSIGHLGIVVRHLSQRLCKQFFNFLGGFSKVKSHAQFGHCL